MMPYNMLSKVYSRSLRASTYLKWLRGQEPPRKLLGEGGYAWAKLLECDAAAKLRGSCA